MVDAQYKFICLDVGANGGTSDTHLFNESSLCQVIKDHTANFPPAESLPGASEDIQYFLVGDGIFCLQKTMMKPYSIRYMDVPSRVFNYRLSRARRVVENVFGILAARFRILLREMAHKYDTAVDITLAC